MVELKPRGEDFSREVMEISSAEKSERHTDRKRGKLAEKAKATSGSKKQAVVMDGKI